jgi:hypothetical protein
MQLAASRLVQPGPKRKDFGFGSHARAVICLKLGVVRSGRLGADLAKVDKA